AVGAADRRGAVSEEQVRRQLQGRREPQVRFMQWAGALLLVATLAGGSGGPSGGPTGKGARPKDKTGGTSKGGSKLVGTWRFVRSSRNNQTPGNLGTKVDFMPDGKVTMHGPGYANAGTYSLDKNILTVNATVQDKFTVARLTEKELVLEIP